MQLLASFICIVLELAIPTRILIRAIEVTGAMLLDLHSDFFCSICAGSKINGFVLNENKNPKILTSYFALLFRSKTVQICCRTNVRSWHL